jgi:hypothetical protein
MRKTIVSSIADCSIDVAVFKWHVGVTALEFSMAHISGANRSQVLLLPEAVDDYVGPDNPVRFIDAFVDGLDLEAAGFIRAKAKTTD